MWNGEVSSEYTPVEQKQHKKHENDQWRLLLNMQESCQYVVK